MYPIPLSLSCPPIPTNRGRSLEGGRLGAGGEGGGGGGGGGATAAPDAAGSGVVAGVREPARPPAKLCHVQHHVIEGVSKCIEVLYCFYRGLVCNAPIVSLFVRDIPQTDGQIYCDNRSFFVPLDPVTIRGSFDSKST